MRGLIRTLGIAIILIFINMSLCKSYAIDNINFKNISIEEGLSQITAETMLQDSKGYLWFGTNDGLNKIDVESKKIKKYINQMIKIQLVIIGFIKFIVIMMDIYGGNL